MEAYLAEHPDTLANGWDQIYINYTFEEFT